MRELHCACGNRLVAQSDQELTREVLTHAHEVHPEMDLTEEQGKKRRETYGSTGHPAALWRTRASCMASAALRRGVPTSFPVGLGVFTAYAWLNAFVRKGVVSGRATRKGNCCGRS